jgi:hypothetical protein
LVPLLPHPYVTNGTNGTAWKQIIFAADVTSGTTAACLSHE